MAEPAQLDLHTFQELPVVTINGTSYPLRNANVLSPLEEMEIDRHWSRAIELLLKLETTVETEPEEYSAEDLAVSAELTKRVNRLCRILLGPEALESIALLQFRQRMQVFRFFTHLLARATTGPRDTPTVATSPGTNSSPNSVDSTEAIPSSGTRKSRSGSSKRT